MPVILFTMRDVEQQYANFAVGEGRRRTRGSSQVPVVADPFAPAPAPKPSQFRPESAGGAIDPFATPKAPSIGQQARDAAKNAPTYMRRTKRGAVVTVKKGVRKAKRAVTKLASPGVRAGAGNISTGVRQIAGDVAVASRRAGRGVLANIGANKGKYALGALALGGAAAGANYLMNRNKENYSRHQPRTIYFNEGRGQRAGGRR